MAAQLPDREVREASATPVRLADPVAALSLVSDLGFGLPPESALRFLRCEDCESTSALLTRHRT